MRERGSLPGVSSELPLEAGQGCPGEQEPIWGQLPALSIPGPASAAGHKLPARCSSEPGSRGNGGNTSDIDAWSSAS